MWIDIVGLGVDIILGILGVVIVAKLVHAETFIAEKFQISDKNASDIINAIYRAGRIASGDVSKTDFYNELLRSFRSIVQMATNTSAPKLTESYYTYVETELAENEAFLRAIPTEADNHQLLVGLFAAYKEKILEFARTIASPDVRSKTNGQVRDAFEAARLSFLDLGEALNEADMEVRRAAIKAHDLVHSRGVPKFTFSLFGSKKSPKRW